MEQNIYPEQLETAKARIRAAFIEGQTLTTFTGNSLGQTVDFRKIVSLLRNEGLPIKDCWERNPTDGRQYTAYFLERTKIAEA